MRRAQQLIACVALTACTHVAPYDRARLAHPTTIDEPTGRAATHVQTVTEGATGSGSIVESGCGCN